MSTQRVGGTRRRRELWRDRILPWVLLPFLGVAAAIATPVLWVVLGARGLLRQGRG